MKPLSNALLEAKQCDGEEDGLLSFLWLAATAVQVPESTQRDRQGHSICGIGIIFLDFNHHLNCF